MKVNQISNSNSNFQGVLRVNGGEICPPVLLNKLINNRFVKDFCTNKKNLQITIKHRDASVREVQRQRRDDDLYKITFKSFFPDNTVWGRFLNFLFSKTVRLADDFDYHSEYTNKCYLASERRMKKIFDKLS